MRKRMIALAFLFVISCTIPAYAEPETEAEANEEAIEDYLEYVHGLEAESLSPEEEAEGYVIWNGQKYAAEETVGDSSSEDVIYGGVQNSSVTGTITVVADVPEYIHEEVMVHLTNLNTYKIYGLRLYEVNGYSAQIVVPSGIYMISAGGLTADTGGRFYLQGQQFQVKRGSLQTLVVTVVDTEPEHADEAYHDDNKEEDIWELIEQEETATPSDTEKETSEPSAESTEAVADDEEDASADKDHSWVGTVIATVLFTIIPLGILGGILWWRQRNKRGFYD